VYGKLYISSFHLRFLFLWVHRPRRPPPPHPLDRHNSHQTTHYIFVLFLFFYVHVFFCVFFLVYPCVESIPGNWFTRSFLIRPSEWQAPEILAGPIFPRPPPPLLPVFFVLGSHFPCLFTVFFLFIGFCICFLSWWPVSPSAPGGFVQPIFVFCLIHVFFFFWLDFFFFYPLLSVSTSDEDFYLSTAAPLSHPPAIPLTRPPFSSTSMQFTAH